MATQLKTMAQDSDSTLKMGKKVKKNCFMVHRHRTLDPVWNMHSRLQTPFKILNPKQLPKVSHICDFFFPQRKKILMTAKKKKTTVLKSHNYLIVHQEWASGPQDSLKQGWVTQHDSWVHLGHKEHLTPQVSLKKHHHKSLHFSLSLILNKINK